MKAFRLLYALIALMLFVSLLGLGVMMLVKPDLAGNYLPKVLAAIVMGAIILLIGDLIAKRLDR